MKQAINSINLLNTDQLVGTTVVQIYEHLKTNYVESYPSPIELQIEESEAANYILCKTAPALSTLLKFNEKDIRYKRTNYSHGCAVFENKQISITIDDYFTIDNRLTNATNFNFQIHRYLQFICLKFNKQGRRVITFSVSEYMEYCGLKDKKDLTKQLKEIGKTLKKIQIEYKPSTLNKKLNNKGKEAMRILEKTKLLAKFSLKQGIITHELTDTFYRYFKSSPVMNFPGFLLKMDSRYNPHSFYFGNKLAEHRNMNNGKENQNTTSVQTLINSSPTFPIKEIIDHRFTQLMKKPFERDMDNLSPNITWCYINSDKKELKRADIKDYRTWTGLNIKFELKDYLVIKKKET